MERILGDLTQVEIVVYEPTEKYQNVAKHTEVEKLTPARLLAAEMIRRYWILGIECTYLEVQKLGWFLERTIHSLGIEDPLKLQFQADKYGPRFDRLKIVSSPIIPSLKPKAFASLNACISPRVRRLD